MRKELKGLIPILKSEYQQKDIIFNNKKYAVLDYQLDSINEHNFIKHSIPYIKSEIISAEILGAVLNLFSDPSSSGFKLESLFLYKSYNLIIARPISG